jgi:hypothetical protein
LEVVVWPTRQPIHIGKLIELDSVPFVRNISVMGDDNFTVRVYENATETGFAWEKPMHNFTCVELKTSNLGNFTTGYEQWYFTARDQDCEETVPLVRSNHSSTPGTVE